MDLDLMLDEKKAAPFLSVSCAALSKWRFLGEGPAYHRLSRKKILYRVGDLVDFLKNCRVEPGKKGK